MNKYVIQDTKQKRWLSVDRAVNGMDIVTVVEYVSSFRAATIFNKEETANKILEYIKEEGNYDITNCVVDNVEVYFKDEIERSLSDYKEHLKQVTDQDGKHLSDEQIEAELEEARDKIKQSIEKQFN